MTSPPRTYPLSVQLWREEGAIEIEGSDGRRICTIPVGSIYGSSDATWEYVLYCVQECVEESGYLCKVNTTEAIDCRSKPHAGRFTYRLRGDDTAGCTPRRGPFGKRRGRPAGASSNNSMSTMSDSKRSTANQNKLKLGLTARDGRCLITETPYDSCTAAHIVPFSRPDIYAEILGYRDEWLFEVWMGILLDDRIHRNFDRYDISIYPRGKEWVVHVFYSPDRSLLQYHGKKFDTKRYNLPEPYWPSSSLLLWHHRQCVQMHYRGYSHRMSVEDDYIAGA